jgi:hypothetical protein
MNGSLSISRNSLPAQPTIAKSDDVCLNSGDIVFTATGYAGSLEWVLNGGGMENNNTVTFAGTATGTKTVSARSAQTYNNAPTCYSAEVMQSASVQALPTVASSAGDSRCGEGAVVLTATPFADAVIDWYSEAANGSVLTGGSATNNYTTPNISTGTIYYAQARIATTGCVSASRTAVLATVNAIPDAPAMGGGGSQCGGTMNITASPGSGGNGIRWTDGSGTEPSRNVGTGTYYAVTTSADGCESGAAQVSVTIHTVPGAPTMSGGGAQCGGTLPIYASAGSGGNGIRWTDSGTEPSRNVGTGTYHAVTISADGCESGAAQVSVTIHTVPDAPAVSGGGTQCGGTLPIYASAGSGGNGIRWLDNSSPDDTRSVGTGTYYAVTMSADGCESGAAQVSVTIHTVPDAPAVSGGGTQCGGTLPIYASAGNNGTGIRWEDNGSIEASRHVGTGTYYAVTTSADGCESGTASVVVTINPVPEAPNMGGGGTQCGGTMDITATPGNNGTGIRWTDGSGTTETRNVGTGTYYAVTTSADGCESNAAQVSVTIHAVPDAPTMGGGGTQCGGTMDITATPGSGGNGIRWTDGSGTTETRNVGTGTYYAVTTSADGCESGAAQVSVTIHTVPEVPAMGGGGTQCGGTMNITASAGNNGNGIRWSDGNIESSRNVGTGTYYAVTTSADGCESGAAQV